MSDSTYEFAPQGPEKKPEGEGSREREAPVKEGEAGTGVLPPLPAEALKAWTCPHCGFERMGKPAKGRCPECSGQMEVGAAADLLQFARSGWVRGLSWGSLVAAAGLLGHLAGAVLGTWWGAGQVIYVQVGAGALVAGGLWLLTSRERGGGTAQRRRAAGEMARWSAVAALVLWGVLLMVMRGESTGWVPWVLAALCGVQAVVALSGGFYLAALGARIPSDSLAAQLVNIAWLVPVVLGIVAVDLFAGLQTQFGFLFYCVFPVMGVMAALVLWPAAALVQLGLELRNAAVAGEAIVAKREARAAAEAAKKAARRG